MVALRSKAPYVAMEKKEKKKHAVCFSFNPSPPPLAVRCQAFQRRRIHVVSSTVEWKGVVVVVVVLCRRDAAEVKWSGSG